MSNPFEILEQRLANIELLLLDMKHPPKVPEIIPEERFYGDKELAKYLKCSVQTIHTLKQKAQVTFHRMGRRCYYLRSEVDRDLVVEARKFGKK